MRSSDSSCSFRYPFFSLRSCSSCLRLLPRLFVTSILPCIFPSITCFRRQFLRKMWPFLFSSFHALWSSYFWPLFEVSNFQHHTKLYFKCSTLLVSSLNLSPIYWLKDCSSCWKLLLHDNPEFHFPWTSCISC